MSPLQRSRLAAAAVAVALAVGPIVGLASVALGEPASAGSGASSATRSIVPEGTRQLLVGVTDDWSSRDVVLQRHERMSDGTWSPEGAPWRGRLGAGGLAWGRGLHPIPQGEYVKVEGDRRSPAGVFRLPGAFGYDPAWATRTRLPYVAVTSRDLFFSDPTSPLYNTHVRLGREAISRAERNARMHTVDPAFRLRVFVAHNREPVVPGGGSAIFLHIWRRGGLADTAGCTAMADADLEALIRWLDPANEPLYVLLPRAEYEARQAAWDLPPLAGTAPPTTSTSTTSTTSTTIDLSPDAVVPAP